MKRHHKVELEQWKPNRTTYHFQFRKYKNGPAMIENYKGGDKMATFVNSKIRDIPCWCDKKPNFQQISTFFNFPSKRQIRSSVARESSQKKSSQRINSFFVSKSENKDSESVVNPELPCVYADPDQKEILDLTVHKPTDQSPLSKTVVIDAEIGSRPIEQFDHEVFSQESEDFNEETPSQTEEKFENILNDEENNFEVSPPESRDFTKDTSEISSDDVETASKPIKQYDHEILPQESQDFTEDSLVKTDQHFKNDAEYGDSNNSASKSKHTVSDSESTPTVDTGTALQASTSTNVMKNGHQMNTPSSSSLEFLVEALDFKIDSGA